MRMLSDSQSYDVYIESESDVFTLEDRAELDALAGKFAPGGIGAMKSRAFSLKEAMRKSPGGEAVAAREWLEGNPVPDENEMEAIVRLRDKAHRAKTASMDPEGYQTLVAAVAHGYVSEEDAGRHIHREQMAARRRAFETANAMIMNYSAVLRRIDAHPEATMDASDKAAQAGAFEEFERWERAKEDFRARYRSCKTIQEKADMRARFPELAKAAL